MSTRRRLDRVRIGIGLLGLGLLTASQVMLPEHRQNRLIPFLRGLGRPFALPFILLRTQAAEERGDVGAELRHLEAQLAWQPDWTDGRRLFAFELARARRNRAVPDSPKLVAARLARAIAWLETEAEHAKSDAIETELLVSAALLAQGLTRTREARHAFETLLGTSPAVVADRLLARAGAVHPSEALVALQAFMVFELLDVALRAGGSKPEVLALVEAGIDRMRAVTVSDPSDRSVLEATAALHEVRRALTDPSWEPPPGARSNPYLAPLLPLLEQ